MVDRFVGNHAGVDLFDLGIEIRKRIFDPIVCILSSFGKISATMSSLF